MLSDSATRLVTTFPHIRLLFAENGSKHKRNEREKHMRIATIHGFRYYIQGGPKKSKPPPIFQIIALKIANEIRFLRKVKV